MNVSPNLSSLLTIASAILLISGSQASALVLENFQNDTPGEAPAGATVILGTDGQVTVAGSGTTPADPFGIGGNQSLYFNQPGTGFSQATFAGSPGVVSGTVVLQFFPAWSDGNDVRAIVRLQDSVTATDWGPWFQVSAGNRMHVIDGATLRRTTTATNWVRNEINEVTLMFDGVSRTYSGTLNGVSFQTEDAAGYVGTSVFAYAGTPSSISEIVLRVGGIAGNTQIFFDDLAVIPEPGMTSLALGVAVLGLLCFRGRQRFWRSTSGMS